MRRKMSDALYRFIDLIPLDSRYRLIHTPFHGLYRHITRVLGSPIQDGYHVIASGPLQGKQIYTGMENVRGYPSVREYIQGAYEPKVTEAIIRNCAPGAVVMDIGAHYGYFSLLMAQTVGKHGRCIAFEASRSNYEKILLTKEVNQLDNLQVEHFAITDHVGREMFFEHVNSLMGTILENKAVINRVQENVPATTIDQYVEQNNISNLSFIKIDIEGAERKAISKGVDTLQKYKPILLIEVHTFSPPDELARPMVHDLLSMDYQVNHLADGKRVDPQTFMGGHILARPVS